METAELASFVPGWLTSRLDPLIGSRGWPLPSVPAAGTPVRGPLREHSGLDPSDVEGRRARALGALLFVDVSGFTRLSGALAAKYGASAAERLSAALDGFFGALLAEARANGGAPISFAGDGLLVCFPAEDGDVASATLSAARAALGMLDRVALLDPIEGIEIGLHAGIVSGELELAALGGHRGRFAPVVLGAPVRQLGRIFSGTTRGQAVIASDALEPIAGSVESRPIADGRSLLVRVHARSERSFPETPREPRAELFLFDAVRSLAGLPLGRWMAETRQLALVFVSLADLDPTDVARADAAVRAVQEELEAHHGALHQVTLDEKGLAVTAAFGLASPGGDRPALSAARCAVAVRDRLVRLDVAPRIGVATGRLFVGPVGDAGYRQLAIVGATMIRAARMAQSERGALLDDATREAAQGVVDVEAVAPIEVRGETVVIWQALAIRRRAQLAPVDLVVGREHALSSLDAALLELTQRSTSAVITLDGPAGIGKSRLAAHAAERARALGIAVLELAGDLPSVDRPYHGLRHELERRLGIDDRTTAEAKARMALAAVSALPEHDGLGPLLGPALGVPMADTRRTLDLTAHRRAELAATLVTTLLVGDGLRLVIVDDAQWLDGATARVALEISRAPAATLMLICTRVPADDLPSSVSRLLEDAARVTVGPLSQADVEALVASTLGVSRAPAAVAHWVSAWAAGNPFFVREVVRSLLAAGLVVVENGRVVREATTDELERAAPPASVEAVVTRRIDALPAPAQLALKVASVLGMRFSLDAIGALHPLGHAAASPALAVLEEAGLVRSEDGDRFEVAHRIVHDVSYALLPSELRKDLHTAAAAWLERHDSSEAAALAWHWEHADDRARAAYWLERAWREADHVGALIESHGLARRALALADAADAITRATWLRRMSDASANLSAYTRAIDEAGDALSALGRRLPLSKSGWQRMLARGLASQLAHRALPTRAWARGRLGDDEAALALARAGEGFFFVQGDQLVALACFLASVNAAERVSETMVGRVPNAFGVVGTAATAMGMPRVGAYYHQRALRTALAGGAHRDIAPALFHIASCQAMQGDWVRADETYEQCAEHCLEAGQRHSLVFVRAAQSLNNLIRGSLTRAETMAEALSGHATALRHERGLSLVATTRAMVASQRGDLERADGLAREARDSMHGRDDLTWVLPAAILARVAIARGRPEEALAGARAVTSALRGKRPVDYRRLEGFAGPAEVLVRIPGRSREEVDEALDLLARFARSHRVGWPRYHLLRGIVLARGKKKGAEASLREALRLAEERDLAIDRARAQLALGRLCSDPALVATARASLRVERIEEALVDIEP